jgi:hypothetical protein
LFFQSIAVAFNFSSVKKKKTNDSAHVIVFFFQVNTARLTFELVEEEGTQPRFSSSFGIKTSW